MPERIQPNDLLLFAIALWIAGMLVWTIGRSKRDAILAVLVGAIPYQGIPGLIRKYYRITPDGVPVVVLVPLEERLDVLRRDQPDVVAELGQASADVVGARAGLHTDQAARHIREPAFQLTARVLQLQDDRATPIEADQVEGVLAEVDTDRGDRGWCRIA